MNYKYEGKTTENEHEIIVEGRLIPQPTDRELLLMANLIRQHCVEKEECRGCVFHNGGWCDLCDSKPMGWDIKESDWIDHKLQQERESTWTK